MTINYKNIAIIPARSGSKGLKNKNIKLLAGKPLIAYTIEAALNSGIFKDVVVSTDSEEYAETAQSYGAQVPFLRSSELASDTASSADVITDVLNRFENSGKNYDFFTLLQPTSPLRTAEDIKNAWNFLLEKRATSVVSVCETDHSPLLSNTLPENLSLKNFLKNSENLRRQDLPVFYRINGAMYFCKTNSFRIHKTFYGDESYAFIMDKRNSVDIDDIIDFKLAEILLKEKL